MIPLWTRFERRARAAVAGAALFLASGVGTIADGVLRLPCPERLSPGWEARLEAGLGLWMRLLLVATAAISLPPMVRLWQLAPAEAERSVEPVTCATEDGAACRSASPDGTRLHSEGS